MRLIPKTQWPAPKSLKVKNQAVSHLIYSESPLSKGKKEAVATDVE